MFVKVWRLEKSKLSLKKEKNWNIWRNQGGIIGKMDRKVDFNINTECGHSYQSYHAPNDHFEKFNPKKQKKTKQK